MSLQALALPVAIIVAVAFVYWFGFAQGFAAGRDRQWLEDRLGNEEGDWQ